MRIEMQPLGAMPLARAYIPPFPPRPTRKAGSFRLFLRARKNILAVWPDFTFAQGSFSYVALGRRIHIVSTPDCVREVFVDNAGLVERKTVQQRRALEALAGDGLIVSDGRLWRERRRSVAPVTHVSRLAALSRSMTQAVATLADDWNKRAVGRHVDVVEEMALLTAGIITTALFGSGVDPRHVSQMVEAFADYQRRVVQIDVLSLCGRFDRLPRLGQFGAVRAARRARRALDAIVTFALSDAGSDSLIRTMAQGDSGGRPPMDHEACRNEAAVMLLAGHETTANLLAWAFFILSQDAESEARLHAEVDCVLAGRAAVFEDLERLPFTKAIVQETLRLYPPVPLQARVASGDFKIGEKQVRDGDIVMLNAFILHRHRGYWIDPDAFRPSRFLPNDPLAPVDRYAYVPFGIGPRVCTGAAFGQTEAILCLATLAGRFRLRLEPGHRVEPVCRLSLKPGHELPMIIERRGAR